MKPVLDPETRQPVGATIDHEVARRPEAGLTLDGRFVRLVPVDPEAHAADLFDASHGSGRDALWQYLMPEPFPDLPAFRGYLERAAAAADPFMMAILDRGSGRAVGHACFMRIEPAHRVMEIGNILYTPALQRGPGGTEAMFLMARHAFEVLGMRRYEWKCNALNAPSRRAAGRYGFTYEGTFRQHMIVKGRNRDTAWYAMLDRDWPARRRAFACWLDPANFDENGRQRLALSALNAAAINGSLLRRAAPDDLTALQDLQDAAAANRDGGEPEGSPASAVERLDRTETWLLEGPDGLAGALALVPAPDRLEIAGLVVAPPKRHAGLGRALLDAAETRAKALGLPRLRVGVETRTGVDWLERRGYATDEAEELPDGRRLVHMTKLI